MAEESSTVQNPPTQSDDTQKAQTDNQTNSVTSKDVEGKTPEEIVKIVAEKSQELGVTKAQVEDLLKFQNTVQPFIETIVADPKLLKVVEDAHAKRTGQSTEDTKAPGEDSDEENKKIPDANQEMRKQYVNTIIKKFETDNGIDKLNEEDRKKISISIGNELFEQLDPNGSKSYDQVLSEIPLDKLESRLEKAYKVATFEDQVKKAKESGEVQKQSGMAGMIGSMPANSQPSEEISLDPREQELAKKLNIPNDKYLERKKQIISRMQSETTR